MPPIDASLIERLYRLAGAERWEVPRQTFAEALDRSATKAFAAPVDPSALEQYFGTLRLNEVALACACAAGHEAAWDHFVLEYRPALYRAADAIDRSGGGRELADSLYGELFGLRSESGSRRSLFRYYHGRSSLATWLRAVLTQRHIDGIRQRTRLEPLPDEPEAMPATSSQNAEPAIDRPRFMSALQRVLTAAIAGLAANDRLRLACYYGQAMTLAAIGRLLREHEATVSRNLARTRKALRMEAERRLRQEGFGDRELEECFASAVEDPGSIDVSGIFRSERRKESVADRSTSEGVS